MKSEYHGKVIVSGYINGRKFRPSNWAERVAESGGIFHADTKIFEYSPFLNAIRHPQYGDSLLVDFDELAATMPGVFEYVVWFVETNGLEIKPILNGDGVHEHSKAV